MAKGINKVILIGNLGKEPEVKYMPNGDALCNLTVATSDTWKDKQTGENKEQTEWHRVTFFGRLAEIAGEYLKKGSKVYIEGSLRTRKYTDNNGIERYATEVRGAEMQMLGGYTSDSSQPMSDKPASSQTGATSSPNRTASNQRRANQPPASYDNTITDDMEIPF